MALAKYLKHILQRPYIWVILAALGTILHTGPLFGTGISLVFVVITQVYLPGWLLARVIGKTHIPHPIARWAWILGSGLGLTITLGSIARILGISVPAYLFGLHLLMLVLALLPSGKFNPAEHTWKPTRNLIPLYLLLGFCIAVVVWVSFQSRYRFWGFEDQPIFIGQAEWMASMPYAQPPGGLPILSRQISVAANHRGDTRLTSDGWTYTHAAWVWTSGVPASQLIWYDLTALFIWAGPLIAFALGFELTGRETVGIWTAVALTLAGLFAVDGLVYTPNYEAFGRLSVFQVNTLRFFTLTILLPLALTLTMGYLRTPRKRELIIIAFIGAALAFVHPFGITLFAVAIGATAILTAFHTFLLHRADPKHIPQLGYLIGLCLILAFLLIIPLVQRLDRSGLNAADSLIKDSDTENTSLSTSLPDGFIALSDLPLLGNTYIRDPRAVFYHPVIAIAALLGLLAWRGWRHNLTERYIAVTTSLMLLIAFLPGLTAFINRFMATLGLYTTTFLLPVALILGLLLDHVFRVFVQWLPRFAYSLATALAVLWMLITLTEPFPIPMSAHDELSGFNIVQSTRRLQPYQMELIAHLRKLFQPGQLYVVTTPYTISNLLTEELPGVFITGGRASRNAAYAADARIYTMSEPIAPWWDAEDVAFVQKYGVTHLILEADDTRLAQAITDDQRFTLLDTIGGYFIFEVHRDMPISEDEQRFKVMNGLYAHLSEPRWSKLGFRPERDGSDAWTEIVADWQAQPNTLKNQLGLAFSLLMANRDADALPVWENLYQTVPNVPLFAQANSQARYAVAPDHVAIEPLLANLQSNNPILRVMAARSLFDVQFFYLLTPDEQVQVTATVANDAVIWHQMAVLDRFEQVRRRAGLLMNAGLWSAASVELESIAPAEIAPQDVISLAALRLVQGDRSGALAILQQSSDPDWVASRAVMHPDRWENNLATDLASKLLSEQTAPLPKSLWTLADAGRLYVLSPQIERNQDEQTLDVSAWFSNLKPFADPYPFQNWRFQVINPSTGETYALQDVPTISIPDALVQGSVSLVLPSSLPTLTPGHVTIQPRYDDRIFAQPIIVPFILNRPPSAQLPPDAQPVNTQFGDRILLQNVLLQHLNDEITVHLYWQVNSTLSEDYQVFVHVFDESGTRIAQRDSAPVDGLYPTSQWRLNMLIDDQHNLQLPASLLTGTYTVRIGLYHLPDGGRLSVIPSDHAIDNSLQVATFTVP